METKKMMSMDEMLNLIKNKGGFSVNPTNGSGTPSDGFMVSLAPEEGFEKQIPMTMLDDDPEMVIEAIENAQQGALERGEAHYIGAWADKGVLYIDVSQHFKEINDAIQTGCDRNQVAIWWCEKNRAIKLPDCCQK